MRRSPLPALSHHEENAMSATIWFAPWKPGPAAADGADGEPGAAALVSVTEFTPHRPWNAIGIGLAGTVLRRTWQDTGGAVGLWLWMDSDLLRPRSGSVSVWRDEKALYDFVAREDHRRIVRSYRSRGTMRATTWRTGHFTPDATEEAARALLTGRTRWPV
ncbi:hypothetical protein ACPXCE_24990 [Streptomyces sp. DT24]|uniref:hypothetical protein n=1 Tax=unclassified Streptomyces TaxID=2593676 RepID=UPI0023B88841|nr:hypothetical protein [Streptomyces sp. AM 4-1-1]WEH32290.1 hypothetical protein PZB75_02180 [Streptomyces sp. AM 4-1-1]